MMEARSKSRDYDKAMKVILSCKTYAQTRTAYKYYKLFMEKYDPILRDPYTQELKIQLDLTRQNISS